MKLTHNDAMVTVPEGTNITDFLALRNVKHPKWIVFELNGEIIAQDKWSTTVLQEDDDVSSDYLAGGG